MPSTPILSRKTTAMIGRRAPSYMRLGLKTDLLLHQWFYSLGLMVHKYRGRVLLCTTLFCLAFLPLGGMIKLDLSNVPLMTNSTSAYALVGKNYGNDQFISVLLVRDPKSTVSEDTMRTLLLQADQQIEQASGAGESYKDMCRVAVPSELRRVSTHLAHNGACLKHLPGASNSTNSTIQWSDSLLVRRNGGDVQAMRGVWPLQGIIQAGEEVYTMGRYAQMQGDAMARIRKLALPAGVQRFVLTQAVPAPEVAPTTGSWFATLIVFLIIIGSQPHVGSKVGVALASFVNVLLANLVVVISLAVAGIDLSYLIVIGWYFLFAVGVDDCVLIITSVRRTPRAMAPARRLATALSESATSIFATTVTDVLVFVPGMFSSSSTLSIFCTVLVAALILDFLLQLSWFTAVLAYDLERESAGRGDCCCCIKCADEEGQMWNDDDDDDDDVETGGDNQLQQQQPEAVRMPSRSKPPTSDTEVSYLGAKALQEHQDSQDHQLKGSERAVGGDEAPNNTPLNSNTSVDSFRLDSGRANRDDRSSTDRSSVGRLSDASSSAARVRGARQVWTEDGQTELLIVSLGGRFSHWWGRVSVSRAGTVINVLVTLTVIAAAVFGATCTMTRTGPMAVRVPGGETDRALQSMHAMFPVSPNEVSFLVEPFRKLTSAADRQLILQACDLIDSLPARIPGTTSRCWLRDMIAYANGTAQLDSDAAILQLFKQYAASSEIAAQARRDVLLSNDKTRIQMSRLVTYVPRVEEYNTARAQLDGVVSHMKAVINNGVMMPSCEEYGDIVDNLLYLEQLGVQALVAVFLVVASCCVLLINPFTAVIVGFSMVVSALSALTINVISGAGVGDFSFLLGLLTLSGGVDFSAHMVLHFNTAQGTTKQRIQRMFTDIGSSVLGGYFTSASSAALFFSADGGTFGFVLVLQGSLLVSFLFAWFAVPMLLSLTKPPMAIRSVEQEQQLRMHRTELDAMEKKWRRNAGNRAYEA